MVLYNGSSGKSHLKYVNALMFTGNTALDFECNFKWRASDWIWDALLLYSDDDRYSVNSVVDVQNFTVGSFYNK